MSDLPPPPAPSSGWPAPGAGAPPPGPPGPPGAPPGPWGSPDAYTPTASRGLPKAGFWIRFAAALIDVLIFMPLNVVGYLILVTGPTRITDCPDNQNFEPGELCEVPTGSTWAAWTLFQVVTLILVIVYYALLEGRRGQTWGKQAVGIRVVDTYTGQPIGAGRGVGRYFARILSALPCLLGYLWMLWDPQRQTFHDKLASSVVVRT